MRALVLEDDVFRSKFFREKFCSHDLKITDNAFVAIEFLKELKFDYICIDNDLGEKNGEGIDVANFLYKNPDNLNNRSILIIHSWNGPASKRIKSKIPSAVIAPFNTDIFYNLILDI